MKPPQALQSTYAVRLGQFFSSALIGPPAGSALAPIAGTSAAAASQLPERRTTKRGTTAINYAEIDVDDDSDAPPPPPPSHHLHHHPLHQHQHPLQLQLQQQQQQQQASAAAGGAGSTATGELTRPRFFEPFAVAPRPLQVPRPLYCPHRSEAQLLGAAALPTVLIPIRLDLDLPGGAGRLHDTFLWNLHETLITPDLFAQTMGADLELPPPAVASIAASIRDQLAEYAPVGSISIADDHGYGFRADSDASADGPGPGGYAGEMRAICALTVNLDDMVYTDRFEWDLANSLLTPELFARVISSELGLRSEFVPAIAAGIYEFFLQRKKDLYDSGLPEFDNSAAPRASSGGGPGGGGGGGGGDGYGGSNGNGNGGDGHAIDSVDAGWRLDVEGLGVDWEPRVEQLTRDEIEKREIDREREVRRLRRETARFGAPGLGLGIGLGDAGDDLGRGGRSRVRKRLRSASPSPVDGDWERAGWRCLWCAVPGLVAWAAGDGPDGQRTLCWNCSYMWKEPHVGLQEWAQNLHR